MPKRFGAPWGFHIETPWIRCPLRRSKNIYLLLKSQSGQPKGTPFGGTLFLKEWRRGM
jgi:hypothetical protein